MTIIVETLLLSFIPWPLVYVIIGFLAIYRPDLFNYQGYYPPNDIRRYIRRNGINFSSWMDLSPSEWDYAIKIAPKIFFTSARRLFLLNCIIVNIAPSSILEPTLIVVGGVGFWLSCYIMYKKAKKFFK